MQLSTFLTTAVATVFVGALAFRVIDLEQRVAGFAAAGEPGDPASGQPAAHSDTTERDVTALERRIGDLERRMLALTASASTPARGAADCTKQPPAEEHEILSVVERENARVRDIQLEWHRARWLQARQGQLSAFAQSFNLNASQTDTLQRALERELDAMVDVLKRPSLAEDPDQAIRDWQALLAETDKVAGSVLSPEQREMWKLGRVFERRTYWPWLPEQQAE